MIEEDIEYTAISFKEVSRYIIELRMRLQRAGISIKDVSKLVIGKNYSLRDFKLFLLNKLTFKENDA